MNRARAIWAWFSQHGDAVTAIIIVVYYGQNVLSGTAENVRQMESVRTEIAGYFADLEEYNDEWLALDRGEHGQIMDLTRDAIAVSNNNRTVLAVTSLRIDNLLRALDRLERQYAVTLSCEQS